MPITARELRAHFDRKPSRTKPVADPVKAAQATIAKLSVAEAKVPAKPEADRLAFASAGLVPPQFRNRQPQ